MEQFDIATGLNRTTKTWKNIKVTWEDFIRRLHDTTRTAETQGEYTNMTKSQQSSIKDVGGFVAGYLNNGVRNRSSVRHRSMLTLDADFATNDFYDTIRMFASYTYCIYSTHKHTAEKPRLRLIIPLSRNCFPEEYEAVARKIAEDIGIDAFDDTTYQPHRLMYWPSTSLDGEYVFKHEENRLLDVDSVLSRYTDWKDVASWPFSSRTERAKDKLVKKQEDPTLKKNIVGAFCRCYDIPATIETFLSDVYEPCAANDRYTYKYGSTAAGLVLYEGGKFAYSNHATDPASSQLCNAFDLVRLHKFGGRDLGVKEGTPAAKMPSYVAMQEFAASDKAVKLLMYKERTESATDDFQGLTDDAEPTADVDNNNWVLELDADSKGNYYPTIDNCIKIYSNDKHLKNKIAFNTFTRRHTALGALPWNATETEREWTDTDDAGLRHYTESVYGIKAKATVQDAWTLVSMQNQYNPVYDYLNCLKWDGIKRVESLFVEYLGAADTKYVHAVTRKALAAAVARIFVPGIKYDNVLTLVGPQGCFKSYMVHRLGKNWSSDTLTTVQGKEAYEQLQGFWLIEIAELAALRRNEVEAVKHFTAKSEDAYRAAYGHHTEVRKRQCIFIGTTNQRDFLRDQTGNRRFLPVDLHPENATKNVFKDFTDSEINQVWAEAVQIYKSGEELFMDTIELQELAKKEQEEHFEESPLTGDVVKFLSTLLPENWAEMDLSARRMYLQGNEFGVKATGTIKRERVCPLEVWCEAFGGERKDFSYQKCKEIKDIIARTGDWESVKSGMRFGELYGTQRGFRRR